MQKTEKSHETLALRLSGILCLLNESESISRQELAQEFKVSDRTLYRDLHERLAGVVEHIGDGRYRLTTPYRGRLSTQDLQRFAQFMGLDGLFPKQDKSFLLALLDTLTSSSYLIKGGHYEKLPRPDLVNHLDPLIQNRKRCCFEYKGKQRKVEPYRVVNNCGIWYLAATENQVLKAFNLSRISLFYALEETFVPEPAIQKRIEKEDGIWFSEKKTEVIVNVNANIAYYFKRRDLLPYQEIVKECTDGGLILSSQISHANQILPLIRYWLPNINIITPEWLGTQLKQELQAYLSASCTQPRIY